MPRILAITLIGIGMVNAATMSTTSPLVSFAIDSTASSRMPVANVWTARLLNIGAAMCRNRVCSGGSASRTTLATNDRSMTPSFDENTTLLRTAACTSSYRPIIQTPSRSLTTTGCSRSRSKSGCGLAMLAASVGSNVVRGTDAGAECGRGRRRSRYTPVATGRQRSVTELRAAETIARGGGLRRSVGIPTTLGPGRCAGND